MLLHHHRNSTPVGPACRNGLVLVSDFSLNLVWERRESQHYVLMVMMMTMLMGNGSSTSSKLDPCGKTSAAFFPNRIVWMARAELKRNLGITIRINNDYAG